MVYGEHAPDEQEEFALLHTVATSNDANTKERAFNALFDHFYSPIQSLLQHKFQFSPEVTEELAAETLHRVWRFSDSFEGRSTVSTWIFTIAVNVGIGEMRRRKREVSQIFLDDYIPEGYKVADYFGSTSRSVEAQVEEKESALALLGRLSAREMQVLLLREIQGASYEEIAAMLGIHPVTSRVFRSQAAKKIGKNSTEAMFGVR